MKVLMAESLLSEPELRLCATLGSSYILSLAGRSELHALMRIGQGRSLRENWHRGLVEAENLGDEAVTATLIEDPDLHDHLMKSLYET
jgi:hypothetical protein